MIEYSQTNNATAPTPRLLVKYLNTYAKRGRKHLTLRKRRHKRQLASALESIKVGLGDDQYDLDIIRLTHTATAIRATTTKFGERRTIHGTRLFRMVRDNPDVTGVGWLGKLHGSCIILHTDHGRTEWGKP